MIIHRAHKIELIVNEKQELYLKKAVGCARFAFNWALNEWIQEYEAYKKDPTHPKPNQYSIRRKLNAIKREQFPWMMEVTKCAVQMAIIQLGQALCKFLEKIPSTSSIRSLKKKYVFDSFTISNDLFEVKGSRIRIPKLGWVRMRESRCVLKGRKSSGQRSRGAANAGT